MTGKPTKKRPEQNDAQAAFTRLQKLTKALLGVDKDEYDRKRAEYERTKRLSHVAPVLHRLAQVPSCVRPDLPAVVVSGRADAEERCEVATGWSDRAT